MTDLEALQKALDTLNQGLSEMMRLNREYEAERIIVEQTKNPDGGVMLRVTLPTGDIEILR